VVGLVGAFITATNTPGPLPAMCILAVFGLHLAWKILLTSDALRRLHGDHRSGALELLLSTPLAVENILNAQAQRTWRIFLPSAIALCLVSALIFTQKGFRDLFVVPIGGALFLFVDARALSWRAMLQALRPGRFPEAVIRVMGLVIVVPLIAIALVIFGMRGFNVTMGNLLFFFYFLGCAIFDAVLVSGAKRILKEQFRLLASQPSSSISGRGILPAAVDRS
jgi:hypothetical protein